LIPFDPCGCVVDLIRHAYVTKMRFWGPLGPEYDVRWYFASPGAKWLPGASVLRSVRTWGDDLDGTIANCKDDQIDYNRNHYVPPPVGEQTPPWETTYDRGANTLGFHGEHYHGNIEAFRDGGNFDRDVPMEVLPGGGTNECPPCNPNAIVVASFERRGAGYVLCLGSPSLFTDDEASGSTPAGVARNANWWREVDTWITSVRPTQGQAGAAGAADAWLIASNHRPTISGVGSADSSYTTPAEIAALRAQLETLGVLWAGMAAQRTEELLSDDAVAWVLEWVRSGGVLVLVDDFEQIAPGVSEVLSEQLDAMNCTQRFAPDEVGPWSTVESLSYRASTYGPGFGSPPYQPWTGGTIDPAPYFLTAQQIGVNSLLYYETISMGFFDPYWRLWGWPSYLVEVTVTATVVGGMDAVPLGVQVSVGTGTFWFGGTIPGQTNTPRTVYTFRPTPHTIHTGTGGRGILLGSFRDVAHQSFTIHAVTYVEEVCHPTAGCGETKAIPCDCAPQNIPVPHEVPVCCVDLTRTSTLTGGIPILQWRDGQCPRQFSSPVLSLLGTSRQRGPGRQDSTALLGLVGTSQQRSARQDSSAYVGAYSNSSIRPGAKQLSSGTLAVVGESEQLPPARQDSTGLLALVGESEQLPPARQDSTGLLGLVGAARFRPPVFQSFQGVMGVLGDGPQASGDGQSSEGLLGLVGTSTQGLGP
jgi:hypothetical protein